MVLIVEEQGDGSQVRENGAAGGVGFGKNEIKINNTATNTPSLSIVEVDKDGNESEVSDEDDQCTTEVDYTRNYWEDEDDVYQEFEELDFEALSDNSDTRSVASDDSFYPPDNSAVSDLYRSPSPEFISFFKACCNNNSIIVKIMIRQGVTEDEVRESDKNRRSGLIVACYHGYVDVVMALSQCPYLDVNWQDNEGNTALIMAAQAGHVFISYFLLNYFPGLDIERRNCHGFSALMKAAMQGRAECVRALLLAGADIQARDLGRSLTPREWALFTGRYETANLMNRLMLRPCAEQFCDAFPLEWPMLEELVDQAQEPKSCWRRVVTSLSCCPYTFYINNKVNPVDDGVFDHMVQVTTCISSPFIATACRTVCPGSPPCIGKRRYAVQEILRRQRLAELKHLGPDRLNHYKRFFQNSRVLLIPKVRDRRASLQPQLLSDMAVASTMAFRRASLLPLSMLRRSSVRPGMVVPKVRLCKAPVPVFVPEKLRRSRNSNQLQIPKWDYKMKRVERRQEEERQRLLPLTRRR
ncbi:ankyrin repeat domain-containing protein 33B-like [Solea senegalensis]|uniref:Ankyrin repeat domain-containing protein 33B-like n=1 Tax=Solea senegalensis TaxID=28829 RepID=A0AAV6T809_SOLSE|nr:ankyrin repeat domain-containing protein 33B [Solea senegalensis]KAG7525539.1 ankyrin repeat domain-containing protein 33B-like [Solea senegalensis]